MKVGILGSGSWTTALAQVLADNGHEPVLKGICEDEVSDINNNHRNEKFFKGVDINPAIKATLNYEDIADAEIILFGVPVVAVKTVATELYPYLQKPIIAINVAKGFEPQSKKRLSLIIKEVLQDKVKNVVSLIGPSHAEEVSIAVPTVLVIGSKDEEIKEIVQDAFMNEYMRIYTTNDIKGVELGGALKNIIAFCAGVAAGIGFGDNTFAALITRGLVEIRKLGVALGGEKDTFYGLSGLGDLIVTCLSEHSRNRKAGFLIGKGKTIEETKKEVGMVIESIDNIEVAKRLSDELNLELPILNTVYDILYNNLEPKKAVEMLMKRKKKQED